MQPQRSHQTQRRELRAARRQLTPRQHRQHAARVTRRLSHHRLYLRARRIALYWPTDGELDPRPLLTHAHACGKTCYLPILKPRNTRWGRGKLWFARFRPGDRMRPNCFGIPEPIACGRQLKLPWHLDLLLMPLVGFDADCHRLGMGGGFYDRTLAYLRLHQSWQRPRLIGLAHNCQRIDRIEPRPWDIPLESVITECRIYAQP
ncbi:5-formyltetrahydrofolate cyclo-ligase [Thiocystis minor]|uniref:5-formyltetrahydrofolate cyclo-ligase n=1 Tax=Thiocystis minor TaxID=61597 RepID=UPI001912B7D6|nr:5-formyltetrahydrofolate cyclo-ligase [Thiocystis minor]MBK5965608.1 5-formyltetrahydrofolate cyclo-ligase [Thiocystis minor]